MKRYIRRETDDSNVEALLFCTCDVRDSIVASILSGHTPILAGISSKEITRSMVRVKSSNVWAYTINIKDRKSNSGDVYVQFKSEKGGVGDTYVYYDVPIRIWKRILAAPSKGHAVWQYLRNNPNGYSKLTGDKRGKLRNAINH